MNAKLTLRQETLAEIIRRVVAVAHPDRVILFGSAARGDMGPDSDADLLVVVKGPVHGRRIAQAIYGNLVGVGFAADILVVTDEDVERFRDDPTRVISHALREGKVVYGR